MSSSFGSLFRITTFGESHGPGVGAIVDGCPARLALSEADLQLQLDRRRPGQSAVATSRSETDRVRILSGVEHGLTLGTPIALLVENTSQRPGDYGEMSSIPRPSHADYTYQMKYGLRSASGGGRASARETIGRVAAGAVAELFLRQTHNIEIVAWVSSVGTIDAPPVDPLTINRAIVDQFAVRGPEAVSAAAMEAAILAARNQHDSIGGVISCVCRNVPAGVGEPIFDKLDALLAQAMLSLPAAKGFEIGSGFAGSRMTGSQHNDLFVAKKGRIGTLTNHSGGVQGGISNGEPVLFRVAFKPVPTIGKPQSTTDFDGQPVELAAKGRHDPCVVPRAVPIVEAMAALVLADLVLRQRRMA